MASEHHMLDASRAVTGDDIEIAGLFEPKGITGKRMLGSLAGSIVGEAVGDEIGGELAENIGQAVGSTAGMMAGNEAGRTDGKVYFVVAVSPTKVYVLRPSGVAAIHRENLTLLHTIDLAHLAVTLHARVSVRTIVLEDTETGDKVELEGSRFPWSHAKATIRTLTEHGEAAVEAAANAEAVSANGSTVPA